MIPFGVAGGRVLATAGEGEAAQLVLLDIPQGRALPTIGRDPRLVVEQRLEGLRQFRARYVQQVRHCLQGVSQRLERARRLLKTLGPESAFGRGFSITLTASGDLVTDPAQVGAGDRLVTRVAGGTIESEVRE